MFGLGGDDRGVEGYGHGYGIGEGDAVFARLFEEGFLSAAVALDGEVGGGSVEAENLLDVGGIEDGVAAAEVPADEFDGEAASDGDAGGFGIAPNVVFGGGSDVAFAAGRAAHDYATADFAGDAGIFLQG